MQHGGADGGRDIRAVVDGPQLAMPLGDSAQLVEGVEFVSNVDRFVAHLDDVDATGKSGIDEVGKISSVAAGVGAEVEPGARNVHRNTITADVAVIGAGIVGLSAAWQLQLAGLDVLVIDPAAASGATFAAAGMIAPASELRVNERHLLDALRWSASDYPRFVQPLGKVGFAAASTLLVGVDAADRRSLADLLEVQLSLGLNVTELSAREARAREPLLSPDVSSAIDVHGDHRVDPRALADALRSRLRIESRRAVSVRTPDAASDAALITLDSGSTVAAAEVIVATGIAADALAGVPALPTRAVFGDILRLRVPPEIGPLVSSTVRGLVRGSAVYIVPRDDGSVVVGATEREYGSAATSAGGVLRLLTDAQALVPAVAELELLEATTRARPGSPDNAPLIGRVGPGLIVANGFYRHGVALAPLAAAECERLVMGEKPHWPEFDPARFPALERQLA